MSNNNNNAWYCLVPCKFPVGNWRLTQHTIIGSIAESNITTTSVAEGSKESLIHAVKDNGLDIFFPEADELPVYTG